MAEKKTEVAAAASTGVIDYKAELAALAVATAEAEKPSGNWFSFRGGIMNLGGNPIRDNKCNVVVIHSLFENQYYEGKFDPNNLQPPVCYAFGEVEEGMAPHPDSAKPQAKSCESCPMNQWKSDPEGGKGKACKNVRRLAMISADDLSADKIGKAPVAMAKIPVTSVKNWSAYASQISNVLKISPLEAVVEMSQKPNAKTQFQIEFQLMDKVPAELLPEILRRRKETTPLIFTPYDKPVEVVEQKRKF